MPRLVQLIIALVGVTLFSVCGFAQEEIPLPPREPGATAPRKIESAPSRKVETAAPREIGAAPPEKGDVATAAVIEQPESKYDSLIQYALTHQGDAERGRQLFSNQEKSRCSICHQIGRFGGNVGPALNGIGGKFDRPHLIESILEPSAEIVEGFNVSSMALSDGRIISGIVRQQSQVDLMLVDVEAKWHRIRNSDVEERVTSKTSLMPTGLVDSLTRDEFTDLVAYLESQRYNGGSPGANIAGAYKFPEGFTVETIATGLTAASAFEVLPDGQVLICEQTGQLRLATAGKLRPEPLLDLDVERNRERGLIGVTVHPQFPQAPYVYICRVRQQPYTHHVISRFTMTENGIKPDSEVVLLEGDDQGRLGGSDPASAQGGAMHFGPDGCLYVALGEQTAAGFARNPNSLLGKILRIKDDGSIPEDNPFFTRTQGKYRSVWAVGLRNPFSFAIRPGTNDLYVADVGGRHEELNVVTAGSDSGWPNYDHGPTANGFVSPIHYYQRSCICGTAFAPSNWPPALRNRLFFGDFVQGWIRVLNPDKPEEFITFAEGLRRPVDLRFGPDGRLYILMRNAWVLDRWLTPSTGSLIAVRYGTPRPNAQPAAANADSPKVTR